jgi:Tfp pilus assembly protein PilN
MIQLNLLPDLKKEFIKSQKTKGVVISASVLVTIATLGLSVLLFIYVTFLQQVQINLATDDINNKEKQLKAIPDINKYLTVQAQLVALPDLHNNKGSYAHLFDYLAVINPSAPNSVSLSTLQLSTDQQTISISGTTASFQTLNVFVDTLKNAEVTYKVNGQGDPKTEKMFTQVLVQSSGFAHVGSQDLVSFAIKTFYNPNVFAVSSTDTAASIPTITTTQSVTQSPSAGQQIFNDTSKGQ